MIDSLEVAQSIYNEAVLNAQRPLRDFALFCANALIWLPVIMLPIRQWRVILLRFVSDDDGSLNKSDMKDATINTMAYYLVVFAIHYGTSDIVFKEEHSELIITFLSSAVALWGGNQLTKKFTHEDAKPNK